MKWFHATPAVAITLVAIVALTKIEGDGVDERMRRDTPSQREDIERYRDLTVEPMLSLPLSSVDNWRASCTVDGGTPGALNDEVDGGIHNESGWSSVYVSNPSAICAHVGSMGGGGRTAVDALTGVVIGTGAGCTDGPAVTFDSRLDGLGCTSEGVATLVRVTAGRQ